MLAPSRNRIKDPKQLTFSHKPTKKGLHLTSLASLKTMKRKRTFFNKRINQSIYLTYLQFLRQTIAPFLKVDPNRWSSQRKKTIKSHCRMQVVSTSTSNSLISRIDQTNLKWNLNMRILGRFSNISISESLRMESIRLKNTFIWLSKNILTTQTRLSF